jgi:hypothetical protein
MSGRVHELQVRVRDTDRETRPLVQFCGHCGRPPGDDETVEARVCSKCGMGVMLTAPGDVAPKPSDPFLVVDGTLSICAMSRNAEKLLGIVETDAVNRHVAEFLEPGDAESPAGASLASMIAFAARGEEPSMSVVVRPANTFGVRYWARVGPCGPPTAALIVLADAR